MEITPENKQILKVINALIEKRHNSKYINECPFSVVTLKHLELIDLDCFEASRLFNDLKNYEAIELTNEEEFKKVVEMIGEEIMIKVDEKIKKGKSSYKQVQKNLENMMKYVGIEPTKEELKKDITLKELESFKKRVTNTIDEELLKSKEIGIYKIKKDLHKMRRYILGGRDFYNMDKEFLSLDVETQIIDLNGRLISIKQNPPLKGQYLLEYILKNDAKKKYPLDELVEDNVIPDGNKRTYIDAVINLNKRVKKETHGDINDLLKKSGDYYFIKDQYTM